MDCRLLRALSTYPLLDSWLKRASIVKWPFSRPLPNLTVFFQVLKEPTLLFDSAYACSLHSFVLMLMVAPNAPDPLVDGPTPLAIYTEPAEDARSGTSTK